MALQFFSQALIEKRLAEFHARILKRADARIRNTSPERLKLLARERRKYANRELGKSRPEATKCFCMACRICKHRAQVAAGRARRRFEQQDRQQRAEVRAQLIQQSPCEAFPGPEGRKRWPSERYPFEGDGFAGMYSDFPLFAAELSSIVRIVPNIR